ncbi:MAG: iron ABC transporter permease [Prevotella sp.]|nr:iron ABC transporter permease [Prevotella sp.]
MKLTIPLLALLCVLALLTGSVPLSLADVVQVFMGGGDEMARFVVLESRLPQLVTALLAGAALSVSGLVMQTLFANPLADPALLGVNSGASLGAALALLLLGGSWTMGDTALAGVALTIVAAFVGACGVIALLTMCSHYLRGNLALLVVGVMLNFVLSAVISLLCFYASADGVRGFVVWGMGDFASVPLQRLPLMAVLVLLPIMLVLVCNRSLNALLLGTDYAANLGISVQRVRTWLLVLTGLLTATTTALCGPISFIGLAVPHLARMVCRTANHGQLVPHTWVLGAGVAVLSLILSHLPGERGVLPLAAITPFMGVPVVIYILLRRW